MLVKFVKLVNMKKIKLVLRSNKDSADFWAVKVNGYLEAGVEAFIRAGMALVEAKSRLPHGEYHKLFKPGVLRVCHRTAQKLTRIACNKVLSNSVNWPKLPVACAALETLCKLGDQQLQESIDIGKVTPGMTMWETALLVKKLQPACKKSGVKKPDNQLPSSMVQFFKNFLARTKKMMLMNPRQAVLIASYAEMTLQELKDFRKAL